MQQARHRPAHLGDPAAIAGCAGIRRWSANCLRRAEIIHRAHQKHHRVQMRSSPGPVPGAPPQPRHPAAKCAVQAFDKTGVQYPADNGIEPLDSSLDIMAA